MIHGVWKGRVKPTSLPEARVEAGAHGRILQNKKLPQGYTFIGREVGENGQPQDQELSQEIHWLMTRRATDLVSLISRRNRSSKMV